MTHKPDIATFTPLPEGNYLAVISGWKMVDKREDYLESERKEWAEKHPSMDFPWWKEKQYQFSMKVIDGDYAGEGLPSRFTTIRLSTDERNGLYKLLKAVDGIEGTYSSLKDRIEAGDAPDFDSEVLGKAVNVLLSVSDNGRNKIEAVTKAKNDKAVATKLADLGFEEVVVGEDGGEIPF